MLDHRRLVTFALRRRRPIARHRGRTSYVPRPPFCRQRVHAMDSQTVFGCDNAVHACFNLYAAYMVCKWMCVFVLLCVCVCFVCVCVCVCVTAGGVRAQRGPGGSRRDVDRSPTECVLSWRLASRRGPQPLFGAPLLKVYAGESGSLWPPSQVHTQ